MQLDGMLTDAEADSVNASVYVRSALKVAMPDALTEPTCSVAVAQP
jgi:hypothetical protein